MMLRAESLTIRQGSFVLNEVSLDCAAGESLALVGASGSGKTTCLEIMAGLRRADSGRVWIDGADVTTLPPERRHVAYLPQDTALFPHLSVKENIAFPARRRGIALDSARVNRVCDMLGITDLLDRRDIASLSGGEAQRVALARALALPPKVVFLDECFASLDPHLRRRLARQFRDLCSLTRTTAVAVTHDLTEACTMADRLAVLHHGSLRQVGTPDELYQRPATIEVARLLGMHNILPVHRCRADDGCWRCDVGGFELLVPRRWASPAPPQWIGFYGWDAAAAEAEAGPRHALNWNTGEGSNVLRLRVLERRRHGPSAVLRLCPESRPQSAIEVHCPIDRFDGLPSPAALVALRIPPERIHAWGSATDAPAYGATA